MKDEPSEDGKRVTNDLSLKESLSVIGKNKYLFIIVGLMLLTFIVNNMQSHLWAGNALHIYSDTPSLPTTMSLA